MSLHTNRRNGYLAAALGSAIGAGILITLGWHSGIAYARTFMPNAELDGLIPPIIGGFVGWWIGAVLGCWLCLRWQAYREAGKTSMILAVLMFFGIFLWTFIHINSWNWINETLSSLGFVQINELVLRPISIGLTNIALALLARALT